MSESHQHGWHHGYVTCTCGWAWDCRTLPLMGHIDTVKGMRLHAEHFHSATNVQASDPGEPIRDFVAWCDVYFELHPELANLKINFRKAYLRGVKNGIEQGRKLVHDEIAGSVNKQIDEMMRNPPQIVNATSNRVWCFECQADHGVGECPKKGNY